MLNQVFLLQQLDAFIRGDNWRRAGHNRLGDSGTIYDDVTVGRRFTMRLLKKLSVAFMKANGYC